MYGNEALDRLLQYDWDTCLDIGCGRGEQAAYMRDNGRNVTTIDINPNCKPDIEYDYMRLRKALPANPPLEAIWCCHVLEHQRNIYNFLRTIYHDLSIGGILALTVPPLKHEIVGGHVTVWNEGLLIYNLILAGFDCTDARLGVYDYNVSVIVRKTINEDLDNIIKWELNHDHGDILKLKLFFPTPIFMHEGKDGRFGNIRW